MKTGILVSGLPFFVPEGEKRISEDRNIKCWRAEDSARLIGFMIGFR